MFENADNLNDELFAISSDTHETAAVMLFLQLLREAPGLRQWLRTVYSHPNTQASRRLDDCVDNKINIPSHAQTGRQMLEWLANAETPRRREIARQQSHGIETRLYGGLARPQIIQLIRRYQSGLIGFAPFLLALAWRNAHAKAAPTAAFHLMSGRFFEECFSKGRTSLIQQLVMAVDFFRDRPVGSITRGRFGYGTWWRISILHYMLNNPKPRYRTGEFTRHLATQKVTVEPKDLRRFCNKHGIARDIRPGRPGRAASGLASKSNL